MLRQHTGQKRHIDGMWQVYNNLNDVFSGANIYWRLWSIRKERTKCILQEINAHCHVTGRFVDMKRRVPRVMRYKVKGCFCRGNVIFNTFFLCCIILRRSMLEVFSWLETACYEHFSGKKQHVAGIIGGKISCCEAFCRQETTYASRVLQRKSVVN